MVEHTGAEEEDSRDGGALSMSNLDIEELK